MKIRLAYFLIVGISLLYADVVAQPNLHWKKIGILSKNENIICGYFWDAKHGLIGTGGGDTTGLYFNGGGTDSNKVAAYIEIGHFAHIYYTEDGQSWIKSNTPISGDIDSDEVASIRMLDKKVGYAIIFNGDFPSTHSLIWKTIDGGKNWIEDIKYSIGWDGYIAQDSTLRGSFKYIDSLGVHGEYGDTFAELDSNVLMSTIVSYGNYSIFYTTNGGKKWNISDSNDMLLKLSRFGCFASESSRVFIIVPNGDVVYPLRSYISHDSGKTWHLGGALPSDNIGYFQTTGDVEGSRHGNVVYVQAEDRRPFWQNRGFCRSTDNGNTWKLIPGGPSNPGATRFCVPSCRGAIVVAFSYNEIWETLDGGDGMLKEDSAHPKFSPSIVNITSSLCDTVHSGLLIYDDHCDPIIIRSVAFDSRDSFLIRLGAFTIDSIPNPSHEFFTDAVDSIKFTWRPRLATDHDTSFIVHLHVLYWSGTTNSEQDTIIILTLNAIRGIIGNTLSLYAVNFPPTSTCLSIDTLLTLYNMGCDTLILTSGALSNTNEYSFLGSVKNIRVPSGDSVEIPLRFHPKATGASNCIIVLNLWEQGKISVVKASLYGIGSEGIGVLSYAPKQFSFPSISICAHDSASGFVANIGCDSMTLDPTTIFGNSDFKLTANSLQLTVKPKDTIWYKVYLNPAQKGLRQGYLVLNSNDGVKSRRDTVPFTVTVTDGTRVLSTSINAVDFGKTTLCEQRDSIIHLSNTGCDTLQVSGIGGLASGFGTNAKFPIIILPGRDTIIHVFTVLDTLGGKTSNSALLTFMSNSDNTLSPISLSRSYIPSRKIEVGFFLDPAMRSGGDQSIVSYDIKETPGKSFTGAGIKQITFNLNYNTNLLDFQSSKSSGNLSSADGKSFTISGSPEITADANGILASVGFRVYLTKDSTTTIDLVNVKIDTTHAPCTTFAFSASGSATFDYQFLCGERSISGFMKGVMPMKIISMHPNPAQDEIVIDLQSGTKQDANIEIRNALGACVYSEAKNLVSGSNSIHLNTKGLAKGIYLIRLWSVKGETSQKFVKIE